MLAPDSEVTDAQAVDADEPPTLTHPCPCCGGRMIIIETFERGGDRRDRDRQPMARMDRDRDTG